MFYNRTRDGGQGWVIGYSEDLNIIVRSVGAQLNNLIELIFQINLPQTFTQIIFHLQNTDQFSRKKFQI